MFEAFSQFGDISSEYVYFDRDGFFPEKEYVPTDRGHYFTNNGDMLPWLRRVFRQYNTLVFHSMFNATAWDFLAHETNIASHSVWVVFGGEIYEGLEKPALERLELMRATTKNVKSILTFTQQEENIVKECLGRHNAVGRYVYLQDWQPKQLEKQLTEKSLPDSFKVLLSGKKVALIGNSGTPANKHREILEALSQNQFNGLILLPLAYGAHEAYRKNVVDVARSFFPEAQVVVLEEPVTNDIYRTILSCVDYYFFAHERQQAGQHWMAALATGMPIFGYMNGASSQHFLELGFHVGDVMNPNLSEEFLSDFNVNVDHYRHLFSLERVHDLWLEGLQLSI
ncbi:hypothetical protein EYQ95_05220 [Lysobacter sp. N42]|nr:hypothetical protein EYQ95_05220 [Lysobacter sp. N42]